MQFTFQGKPWPTEPKAATWAEYLAAYSLIALAVLKFAGLFALSLWGAREFAKPGTEHVLRGAFTIFMVWWAARGSLVGERAD